MKKNISISDWHKFAAVAWATLLSLIMIILISIIPGSKLNTSVMALLPRSEIKDVPVAVLDEFNHRLDQQLIWLISAPTAQESEQVAGQWVAGLQNIAAIQKVNGKIDVGVQVLVQLVQPILTDEVNVDAVGVNRDVRDRVERAVHGRIIDRSVCTAAVVRRLHDLLDLLRGILVEGRPEIGEEVGAGRLHKVVSVRRDHAVRQRGGGNAEGELLAEVGDVARRPLHDILDVEVFFEVSRILVVVD